MSTLGLYRPGASPVHRTPAGVKLLALLLACLGSVFVHTLGAVAAAFAVVAGLYLLAGLSLLQMARQARPVLWLLLVVAAFHVAVDGWVHALLVVGVILVLLLLAALVTLTTTTTALLEALVTALGPLRRLGVDVERVGLVLALGIRSVPVVAALAVEVRDAQRARGLTTSLRAFAVPLIIRALRHADALGEALVARGVDD
jgi:biotin transport system permease protein